MCGLTVLLDPRENTLDDLQRMTATLKHRGPDDAGVWSDASHHVAMGHRRLAIVDLSPAGRNPMSWRSGRYWITYNGEVYNFRSLRAELEGLGDRFVSQTDTEVILAAYERWGTACFEKFVGMFALAIWDEVEQRLVLARDRVGKKPLYYARYQGRFAVASELKAFASDQRFPRTIDSRAVAAYLRYGYIPAPLTIFENARKLEPGHVAVLQGDDLGISRYWDPLGEINRGTPASPVDAEQRLEALLADAVGTRMLADVSVGAFLSGGIDSSLIVALMQEQSGSKVKTFTVRFTDPEYNEADHAAAVARHLKTEHYEQTCSEQEMLEVVGQLDDLFDEPFGDSSAIPTRLVSAIARQSVTVALSGDGGDELFFGYPRYRYVLESGWLLAAPKGVRRALAGIAAAVPRRRFQRAAEVLRLEDNDHYLRFISCWSDREVEALVQGPAVEAPAYSSARQRTSGLPRASFPPLADLVTYLPDDILTKVDRASMSVSLETRCPLLDHRVVEFAVGLPLDLKWRDGQAKWLLRRLLEKRVPRALFDRPKMGFGIPLARWLKGPLREVAETRLCGGALEAAGVNVSMARDTWMKFIAGSDSLAPRIWSLFVLAGWVQRWHPDGMRDGSGAARRS